MNRVFIQYDNKRFDKEYYRFIKNQPTKNKDIYDRFGKLLKELDPLSSGWDGIFIGKPMPSTDYWFRVYLEDGREFKSHFSLVRPW